MCNAISHTRYTADIEPKKYRLADFFNAWWDEYAKNPKEYITAEQYKAVNSIRVCRTPALGIDVYACEECGEVSEIYHSCKNRFCPTCSWQDTLKWADKIKGRMLALPHRHVVMTLPHQLHTLIKNNKKILLNALFTASSDTFKNWMKQKHNIQPGIISVLHTFGETKQYHVHVHMIVSWGGIGLNSGRLEEIEQEYVNFNFLKQEFREIFISKLEEFYANDIIRHDFLNRSDFDNFLSRLNRKKWIIHLEPPIETPTEVIRYIGRYSKRACLSEYKITKIQGEYISFRYKDYKTSTKGQKPEEKEIELHYRDFFPRLLQHVPLTYFRIARYYGCYSHKSTLPQEYLYNNQEHEKDYDSFDCDVDIVDDELICKNCNIIKQYQHTIVKKRVTGYTNIFKRAILQLKNGVEKNAA
jgi:hypothetical protein